MGALRAAPVEKPCVEREEQKPLTFDQCEFDDVLVDAAGQAVRVQGINYHARYVWLSTGPNRLDAAEFDALKLRRAVPR